MAEQLGQLLIEARVVSGEEDGCIWKGGDSKSYSVNSAYNLVRKDIETMFSPIYSKLWKSTAIRQYPLHLLWLGGCWKTSLLSG